MYCLNGPLLTEAEKENFKRKLWRVSVNSSSVLDNIVNPLHFKIADRILQLSLVSLGVKLGEKVCARAKKNNPIMNWVINFGEHSVKFAVDKVVLLPNFVQKPITSVDKLLCSGMDVIEERAEYIQNAIVHPITENKYCLVIINNLEKILTSADRCVDKYLPVDILDTDEIHPNERLYKILFHIVVFSSKIAYTLVIATINEIPLLQLHISELLEELVKYTEKIEKNPEVILELGKNLCAYLSSNQQIHKRIDNYKDLIEIVTFEVAKLIVHFIKNVFISPLEALPALIDKFAKSLKSIVENEVAQVIPLSAL